MIAIASLLIVVLISLLVVRISAVALTFTGLSKESASFQARSAFTGVGFTTSESESLVNRPVRRRVIMMLMFLGNAGIVTAAATLLLSFAGTCESGAWAIRLAVLLRATHKLRKQHGCGDTDGHASSSGKQTALFETSEGQTT